MSALATRLFRGREPVAALDPDDRGFAYGDGLFTTARVHRGGVVWWESHVARLAEGAARLGFAAPDQPWLEAQVDAFLADAPEDAVLKIVTTRGSGGRGYSPPIDAEPTLLLALHPAPAKLPDALALRWCRQVVAPQPALAGMKTLNRLEQVLARREWSDPAIHEGLMTDANGAVVGATSANVFALIDGLWRTPDLHECGIAGIARTWCLAMGGDVVRGLTPAMLLGADAVFLCNAVRGILPVGSLGDRRWAPHPALDELRRHLRRSEPALR